MISRSAPEPSDHSPGPAAFSYPSANLLTVIEAAALLRVSKRTMNRLLASGKIHPVKIQRSTRIDPAELRRYVKKATKHA